MVPSLTDICFQAEWHNCFVASYNTDILESLSCPSCGWSWQWI